MVGVGWFEGEVRKKERKVSKSKCVSVESGDVEGKEHAWCSICEVT